jgi:hypothetical protein
MTLLEFIVTILFVTVCVFGSLGFACFVGMILSWVS